MRKITAATPMSVQFKRLPVCDAAGQGVIARRHKAERNRRAGLKISWQVRSASPGGGVTASP